mmetsp:Transcript_22874/g.73640  ORF Transcript_22874/g.73640 Transcript_22874/m.73640 type:complete len:241 (-) Transcript_22874:301-1023(-)
MFAAASLDTTTTSTPRPRLCASVSHSGCSSRGCCLHAPHRDRCGHSGHQHRSERRRQTRCGARGANLAVVLGLLVARHNAAGNARTHWRVLLVRHDLWVAHEGHLRVDVVLGEVALERAALGHGLDLIVHHPRLILVHLHPEPDGRHLGRVHQLQEGSLARLAAASNDLQRLELLDHHHVRRNAQLCAEAGRNGLPHLVLVRLQELGRHACELHTHDHEAAPLGRRLGPLPLLHRFFHAL